MLKAALRILVLLTLPFNIQATTQQESSLLEVGSATLTKLFWTIYDSRLFTTSGEYRGIESDLVLEIVYQRKISKQQLINSTRDEWQALSLYTESSSEQWLNELEQFWPDVDKSDTIELKVSEQLNSHFYFNGNAIGTINDAEFTRRFLAIWLSPDSRYPKLQRQLTGVEK